MESVRERLVASWNKVVASVVSTQYPKQGVILTSIPAIPVIHVVGKRITEEAPPPQPSKRASFFKGTLEQARLAGLTDEEVASIAAALKPVLEEKSGDSGRSVKRGVLPETRSSQTNKRGKAVLEPSSNSERATPVKRDEYCEHDYSTQAGSASTPVTETVSSTQTRKHPTPPPANQFLGTGQHPRTADREETLRVLMRKTKFSGHSNADTDVADYDGHYLESLFAGRTKSGIIYLGPDELASKHKIRVNLNIGTKNTRIGVPRELEGWMKTTLYRDNTTLRWTLFEDRVAPRHHRLLPDGVDRCVCMLQPARTTVDGVSYMASCSFVNGVLSAQSCEILLHRDVESNAPSDIMIVSDIGLPSKASSKYIIASHSLQPESSTQSSPASESILCTAHALLETCCHMKAKLLVLTIAYPDAWEVLFHVDLCNVLHTLAEHGD